MMLLCPLNLQYFLKGKDVLLHNYSAMITIRNVAFGPEPSSESHIEFHCCCISLVSLNLDRFSVFVFHDLDNFEECPSTGFLMMFPFSASYPEAYGVNFTHYRCRYGCFLS